MEKLIRQDINLPPDIKTRQARPEELNKLLGAKLVEEAKELEAALNDPVDGLDSPSYMMQRRQIIEEVADVLEVVNTILHRHGINSSTVAKAIGDKLDQRGGFIDRVLVTDD